jgi:hypothetical protein
MISRYKASDKRNTFKRYMMICVVSMRPKSDKPTKDNDFMFKDTPKIE